MTETTTGTEVPEDFPHGVGRSDSGGGAIEYTRHDVASARAVLERSEEGEGPTEIVRLSDEQVLGLEGHLRTQPVVLPWTSKHPGSREVLAAAGVRSLIAAGKVALGQDEESDESRWLVDPAINGCLVLRRTAEVLVSAERQVNPPAEARSPRIYCYVHPEGVLEEEVTPAGMHIFRVGSPEMLAARIALLSDQDGLASTSGDRQELHEGDLEAGGPLAERLAEARTLTVVSSLDTRSEAVAQMVVYATTEGVLVQQPEEVDGEELAFTLKAVDPAELLELAEGFLVREES